MSLSWGGAPAAAHTNEVGKLTLECLLIACLALWLQISGLAVIQTPLCCFHGGGDLGWGAAIILA